MTAKKVLLTGSDGFIGSRLLRVLRNAGMDCRGGVPDLFDFSSIEQAICAEKWDMIIHLAAMSHVPTCEKDPERAYRTNLGGTALLLEAIRRRAPGVQLVFASTAQVYAPANGKDEVWDEARVIAPQNLYARTKRAAELLLEESARRGEISTTILRIFNHTHKSQAPEFFLPHIYSQLRDMQAGESVRIPVGNLDLYRDIGSIQDLMSAFVEVARYRPQSGMEVFNVCSGYPKHLETLAKTLASQLGIQATFVVDPTRVREGEPKVIRGSHEKLSRLTGWKPSCESERDLVGFFLE